MYLRIQKMNKQIIKKRNAIYDLSMPSINVFNELDERLTDILRDHIGEDRRIAISDLIKILFNNPMLDEPYKLYFWIDMVTKRLRKLRSSEKVFVIIKNKHCFVLQSQAEADYYKNILDNDIHSMIVSKKKADEWVAKEKWKKLI